MTRVSGQTLDAPAAVDRDRAANDCDSGRRQRVDGYEHKINK
jgi:hypothetical protein